MIGFALCGPFCTVGRAIEALRLIARENETVPIISETLASTDTRFGRGADVVARCEEICRKKAILSIVDAEPVGPARPLDALLIAPCTGNTLAKMSCGITDTCVTMAAKAHMRMGRPTLIALATNDAMSANLANIARLSARKGVFFAPMFQDDPQNKPFSLVADFTAVPEALEKARMGVQIRPLFLCNP